MNKNLFIFAIGGTGSRVLKSLIFLLASGMRIPNVGKIIPIIIDPDIQNGDLTRTVELIKMYVRLRESCYSENTDFFYHEIVALKDLDGNQTNQFLFDMSKIKGKKFKEFIDFGIMEIENQALTSLLYSDKNLDLDMEVGFKGNPNIGSVVLNQLKNEDYFKEFTNRITKDDRIFIISSIFGGTGSAGFPILLKNIRYPEDSLKNKEILREAKIGALSVLPYFKVKNPNGEIDSATFISKTIAALKYYSSNIFDANLIDAFYSIGDDQHNMQEGADGKSEQKNKAHFVEIASALSIRHFMNFSDNELADNSYYEFGCDEPNNGVLNFYNLSEDTRNSIKEPLSRFFLFYTYWKEIYPEIKQDNKVTHIYSSSHPLTEDKLQKIKIDLDKFFDAFKEWLVENKESTVSFQPFKLEYSEENLFDFINGVEIKPKSFFQKLCRKNHKKDFINELNKKTDYKSKTSEKKLMELLSCVTKEIYSKNFDNTNK